MRLARLLFVAAAACGKPEAAGLGGGPGHANEAGAELASRSEAGDHRPTDAGRPLPAGALTGRWIDLGGPRPRDAGERPACSFVYPLCVHRGPDVGPAAALAALASAERAWGALTGSLGFLPPDPDPVTRAYDIYLRRGDAGDLGLDGATTHLAERDPRGGMDRASAFSVLDARLGVGCALDATVARVVARGALYRVAPATDEGSALAATAYLARLLAPCAMAFDDGVATFQASPEAMPFDTHPELAREHGARMGRGAALLPWWMDAAYGTGPGAIVRGIWALSPTLTPLGAARWNNEPDVIDVLRETFKGTLSTGSTLDDLFLNFAAARPFAGATGMGLEAPETQALGDPARVRLAWDVAWPDKPRRLASPAAAAVSPLGSAYVLIRGVPAGARLRVEAAWEEHAAMRWAAVKLDAAGRKLAQIPITSLPKAVEAQRTIADLDGVASVLLVGVNVGDPFYELDPDDGAWEPHGWLVTIAAE